MIQKRIVLGMIAVFLTLPLFASEEAQKYFDQAIALKATGLNAENNDTKAHDLFIHSAQLYEVEAFTDWHKWYETGNAYWWAGQSGRAILAYRRYLSHDSFRGEVWENLASARLSAGTEQPGHEGFLVWPWFLWFASVASFLAGIAFLLFSLFLFFKNKRLRTIALVCAIASLSFAGASAVSISTRGKMAVIVTETQGRKGDSTVYAVSPERSWKVGQEVWVREVRNTWTRIEVGSVFSWVPSESLVSSDASF